MMRAASLTQPWCGLMAAGIKLIENRTQPIIAERFFGEQVGLHSTKIFDPAVVNRIIEIAPELAPRGPYSLADASWYKLGQIAGSVLAVTTIQLVIKAIGVDANGRYVYDQRDVERVPVEQRRWMFGRVCYLITPPIVLAVPVRARGFQGFWKMTDTTEAHVRSQLVEAA